MSGTPLHRQFIYPGNQCFGCGPDNPEGLRIDIHRDGDRTERLVGIDRPRPTAAGFPGIVHGGAQFTVLDCMAGMGSVHPAKRHAADDYEYVLVPQDKFKRVAGLDQLPDHYARHFGEMA